MESVNVHRGTRGENILLSQESESFRSNFKFFLSEDEIMSFPSAISGQEIADFNSIF